MKTRYCPLDNLPRLANVVKERTLSPLDSEILIQTECKFQICYLVFWQFGFGGGDPLGGDTDEPDEGLC